MESGGIANFCDGHLNLKFIRAKTAPSYCDRLWEICALLNTVMSERLVSREIASPSKHTKKWKTMDFSLFPQKHWIWSKKKEILLMVTVVLHTLNTLLGYLRKQTHVRRSSKKPGALSLFVADLIHILQELLWSEFYG